MYKLDKKKAIEKTLELIDKPINEWETFNDKLNIIFLDDNSLPSVENIKLEIDEDPILESKIGDNYLLITTTKIYSIFKNKVDEMRICEFEGFGDEFDDVNYLSTDGKYSKTNIISVKRNEKVNFLFEIDSFYPSNFVKMFLINIGNYIKYKKWFWKNETR